RRRSAWGTTTMHRSLRLIGRRCRDSSLMLLLASCAGGGGGSSPAPTAPSPSPPPPVINEKVSGLDFSPYLDGQSPDLGTPISENQLTARMQLLVPLTRSVRTYSTTHGLENAGKVAHTLGLNITVGAFLSADAQQNALQAANLIAAAKAGETDDTVIVGSEVLERGDLSETALIAELRQVRQALPATIRMGYADTAYQLLAHPAVVDEADVVFANIYPYFDGVPIEQALRHVDFIFTRLQAQVQPKTVMLSETGWPTAGPQRGGAVPSAGNAATYFRNFTGWARAKHVEYFYFEAFDEAWKTAEGAQGPHWGILDSSGNLKTGMSAAFDGTAVTDTWNRSIPGGAGTAALQFTAIPASGSTDNLRGQLTGVDPALYRIVTYICVDDLWYPKPSYASPTTYPGIDGNWTVDVTTGPMDETATKIAAYVLPVAYRVAQVSAGTPNIPPEIETSAVAKREVMR
ncbi:MAG TPA: glycosyl hydrolase family 17 protein, partial [Povalibacter sp.]|nr:glycosyl hydrolase family 17 protein [Povalibacter sp.]